MHNYTPPHHPQSQIPSAAPMVAYDHHQQQQPVHTPIPPHMQQSDRSSAPSGSSSISPHLHNGQYTDSSSPSVATRMPQYAHPQGNAQSFVQHVQSNGSHAQAHGHTHGHTHGYGHGHGYTQGPPPNRLTDPVNDPSRIEFSAAALRSLNRIRIDVKLETLVGTMSDVDKAKIYNGLPQYITPSSAENLSLRGRGARLPEPVETTILTILCRLGVAGPKRVLEGCKPNHDEITQLVRLRPFKYSAVRTAELLKDWLDHPASQGWSFLQIIQIYCSAIRRVLNWFNNYRIYLLARQAVGLLPGGEGELSFADMDGDGDGDGDGSRDELDVRADLADGSAGPESLMLVHSLLSSSSSSSSSLSSMAGAESGGERKLARHAGHGGPGHDGQWQQPPMHGAPGQVHKRQRTIESMQLSNLQ
ncbi:hypothetical protein BC831DRAFT_483229 [Entophlyctis helioformis]|nr:hypothetical protein BC831DRAFT_483229 [Entophlyctis helioformis]